MRLQRASCCADLDGDRPCSGIDAGLVQGAPKQVVRAIAKATAERGAARGVSSDDDVLGLRLDVEGLAEGGGPAPGEAEAVDPHVVLLVADGLLDQADDAPMVARSDPALEDRELDALEEDAEAVVQLFAALVARDIVADEEMEHGPRW
jgi:hypothetical protein